MPPSSSTSWSFSTGWALCATARVWIPNALMRWSNASRPGRRAAGSYTVWAGAPSRAPSQWPGSPERARPPRSVSATARGQPRSLISALRLPRTRSRTTRPMGMWWASICRPIPPTAAPATTSAGGDVCNTPVCQGGTCTTVPVETGAIGEECSLDSECCSGNCFNSVCADFVTNCAGNPCNPRANGCAGGTCCGDPAFFSCGSDCCGPPATTCCGSSCC